MPKTNKQFCLAVEIVGGPAKMARLIEQSPNMVYQMQRGIRPVPATCCHSIEAATGGVIGRAQLQPVGFEKLWPELVA